MSGTDFVISIIKEETDLESGGVLQEVDSPPLGDNQCDVLQQGAALSPVKVKRSVSLEEDDLLQLPGLQAALTDAVPRDESDRVFGRGLQTYKKIRKSSLTAITSNNASRINKIDDLTGQMGTTKVVLNDCMQSLQRSGRFCLQCRVLFSSAHDRRTHQQKSKPSKNTKRKRLKCDQCQYSCDYFSNLDLHKRIHLSLKPYKCDLCNYRATQKHHLKAHQERKHFGYDKPFKCDMCDYKCKERCTLNKHIRTHTQEKQFKCNQCSYSFTDISNLYSHIRSVHAKLKAFKCDQCNHSAARRRDLMFHMLTHRKAKPFKCEQCGFRALESSVLKRHMKRRHATESVIEP